MCTTIASILIHSVYLKGYPVFLGQNLPWSSETNNGWQVCMLPQDCPSITPHALVSHPPELASPHPAVWRPASTCFTAAHKNTKGNAIQYLSSSSISHLQSRSAMQYDTWNVLHPLATITRCHPAQPRLTMLTSSATHIRHPSAMHSWTQRFVVHLLHHPALASSHSCHLVHQTSSSMALNHFPDLQHLSHLVHPSTMPSRTWPIPVQSLHRLPSTLMPLMKSSTWHILHPLRLIIQHLPLPTAHRPCSARCHQQCLVHQQATSRLPPAIERPSVHQNFLQSSTRYVRIHCPAFQYLISPLPPSPACQNTPSTYGAIHHFLVTWSIQQSPRSCKHSLTSNSSNIQQFIFYTSNQPTMNFAKVLEFWIIKNTTLGLIREICTTIELMLNL